MDIFAISRFAIIEKNPSNSSNFNKFLGAISAPLPIYALLHATHIFNSGTYFVNAVYYAFCVKKITKCTRFTRMQAS